MNGCERCAKAPCHLTAWDCDGPHAVTETMRRVLSGVTRANLRGHTAYAAIAYEAGVGREDAVIACARLAKLGLVRLLDEGASVGEVG